MIIGIEVLPTPHIAPPYTVWFIDIIIHPSLECAEISLLALASEVRDDDDSCCIYDIYE